MLLHDLIFSAEKARPSNPALTRGDTTLDYANLATQVRNAAAGLLSVGVQPGERVAVFLNKRIEAVIAYFASSFAGAVFVPVNANLKASQVSHILNDCSVVTLITTRAQATALEEELRHCDQLRHIVVVDDLDNAASAPAPAHVTISDWRALLESDGNDLQAVARIDADVASILYTSGSTGKPKGVVLSHRNMVAGALSVAEYLENDEHDRILAALPFSFDAGFSQMTTAFSVGAQVVLLDYLLPRDVTRAISKYRITGLAGVPPLWIQLARLDWPADAIGSLRYITNTGGAMPTTTLSSLRKLLPQTQVFLMYGLTEAFRSTYLHPDEVDVRPTSIGKAIPNAEILVVREDGSVCGPNEPGELVHRGALVSLGYWNDQEKTAERFKPAPTQSDALPFEEIAVWSGDTVVRDEDGYLYFIGRKDDMIKSSGYRISPTEVEELIYSTGAVNECAALGIPHPELGQAVVLACFGSDSADTVTETILAACRASLPNYMVPTNIVWRDALPRNANGKIDRKRLATELQDLYQEPTPE